MYSFLSSVLDRDFVSSDGGGSRTIHKECECFHFISRRSGIATSRTFATYEEKTASTLVLDGSCDDVLRTTLL